MEKRYNNLNAKVSETIYEIKYHLRKLASEVSNNLEFDYIKNKLENNGIFIKKSLNVEKLNNELGDKKDDLGVFVDEAIEKVENADPLTPQGNAGLKGEVEVSEKCVEETCSCDEECKDKKENKEASLKTKELFKKAYKMTKCASSMQKVKDYLTDLWLNGEFQDETLYYDDIEPSWNVFGAKITSDFVDEFPELKDYGWVLFHNNNGLPYTELVLKEDENERLKEIQEMQEELDKELKLSTEDKEDEEKNENNKEIEEEKDKESKMSSEGSSENKDKLYKAASLLKESLKIVNRSGKYCVLSKKGKLFGCYSEKKDALKRIRQIFALIRKKVV